jgi:hypothetical protein
LVDVAADAYFPITRPPCNELERASVEHIRGRLIVGGIATAAEIDEHLATVASGALDLATSPMISAWDVDDQNGRPRVARQPERPRSPDRPLRHPRSVRRPTKGARQNDPASGDVGARWEMRQSRVSTMPTVM